MRGQKKAGIILLALEFIIIFLICGARIKHNSDDSITFSSDQLNYVADTNENTGDGRASTGAQILGGLDQGMNRRLVTPECHLYPGVYQADISYNTNIPAGSTVGAVLAAYDKEDAKRIRSESVLLTGKATAAHFYIYVSDECDAVLRLVMDDGVTSDITADRIIVTRQAAKSVLPALLGLMCLFLIVDFSLFFIVNRKKDTDKNKKHILAVIFMAVALVSSIPLFSGSLLKGYDMRFHFYRVYALAEGLRSGQFPVYVYPEYSNNYGYAVGIFYPDLFLYIPAMLYLIGVRLETVYMLLMGAINLATVLVSYYSFNRITKEKNSAIVGTVIYSMALPRLVALYTRGALGAAIAYVFAPLFALGLMEMISGDDDEERYSWVHVAIGMSGILASHLLGSIMAFGFAVLFAVLNIKKVIRKNVLFNIAKSVVATALFSAYFLVPFISGMLGIDIDSKANATNIADYAAFPAQLFSGRFNMTGDVNADIAGMLGDMPLTLGLAGLGAGMLIIVFIMNGNISIKNRMIGSISLVFAVSLWMSSTIFPYRWMSFHMKKAYDFVSRFQFAYRFLAVAVLAGAIIVSFACKNMTVKKDMKKILMFITVFAFMYQGIDALNAYSNEMTPFEFSDSYRNLDVSALYTKEYLPKGFDTDDLSGDIACEDLIESSGYFNVTGIRGISMQADVYNPSDEDINVTLPRAYYKGYAVKTEEGSLKVKASKKGKVVVTIPAGFDGTVSLSYKPFISWMVANVISLLTVIILTALYINKKLVRLDIRDRIEEKQAA